MPATSTQHISQCRSLAPKRARGGRLFLAHLVLPSFRVIQDATERTKRCRTLSRCKAHSHRIFTSAADAALTGASSGSETYARSVSCAVRQATVADYWALAEVHAQSFFPSANWLFGPLVRLDRVFALQMGIQADEKGNRGQYACLVACSANAEPCEESIGLAMPGASVPPFFKFLLAEPLQVGFSISPERLGLLGTVVIDTQGQHLPMERVEKGPFIAYEKPEGIAYISNLAVAPQARRQGVGEKLLRAAEKVAMDWGSKGICLHCDPLNEAASALYRKHGYRKVATQTGFLPWLQFGPTVRLNLMKKTVR